MYLNFSTTFAELPVRHPVRLNPAGVTKVTNLVSDRKELPRRRPRTLMETRMLRNMFETGR